MKRIILSIVLTCVLILSLFTGCSKISMDPGTKYYGKEPSSNALRICVDVEYTGVENAVNLKHFFNNFLYTLEDVAGVKDVSVEFLPKEGTERETALTRLRTEVMAGGGPDVFIMNCVGSYTLNAGNALFTFPEKNMDAGLFLPLDEYMENHTQFTNWDKQIEVIMNAGKNEEGQVIIPLAYTFLTVGYPKDEVKLVQSKNLTMQKILNDPETAKLGNVLYDGISKLTASGNIAFCPENIPFTLGKLADFESEELLFTEEELQNLIETAIHLQGQTPDIDTNCFEALIGWDLCNQQNKYNENLDNAENILIPLYSDDGGVTASVTAFAAINRNTQHPEEAFSVIDILMRERTQQSNEPFSAFFIPYCGIPLQEDLFQETKPLGQGASPLWYLENKHYEELCSMREQITAVNFRSELDLILENLVFECSFDYFSTGTYDKSKVTQAYEIMERMIGE